jgi:UDP-N-acetylglucosamine 1-carboxyvinyltransferase
MDKLLITGGYQLRGTVQISGSKNSALPIMAAAILTDQPCIIRNVPNLEDITAMIKLLQFIGVSAKRTSDGALEIRAEQPLGVCPYELVRKMRASICLLGPLTARLKKCKISLPGGCVIGDRPVDIHLKGLKRLGANITVEQGYIFAQANELVGAEIFLGGRFGSTVLGTANLMMAASLAKGTTIIESAACEPEIVDLADFLTKMGARIKGAGSPIIEIEGVQHLHGAEHSVIPDRIEAGTFMVAAAITGGEVEITNVKPHHLGAVWDKLEESGVEVHRNGSIKVRRNGALKPVDLITMPYPGFPTDMQAQMSALMAVTPGISVITEKIFPNRFMHISELARLGANVSLEGASAIVKGVEKLSGAPVMASDLRASAALVIAGLVAEGETEVGRIYHVDRGYEKIDEKLRKLGAKIERVSE